MTPRPPARTATDPSDEPDRPGSNGPTGRPVSGGTSSGRIRFGMLVIAMVLSVFGGRLVQLQAVDPGAYAQMAAKEGMVTQEIPARRGEILDRDGDPLATSTDGMMITADPKQTTGEAKKIAQYLATTLDLDYFTTLQRLEAPDRRFEYIARRVPAAKANAAVEKLRSEGIGGLYLDTDPMRDYPAKDVGANILGYMGAEGQPLGGMERTFASLLAGKDGSTTYEVGSGDKRVPLGENSTTKATDGEDLKLTLDRDVQWYALKVCQQTVDSTDGESGSIAVMRPKTGEVLALVDCPTFDANNPQAASKKVMGADSVTAPFEPGSVSKVFTMAALLEDGKVTPRTRLTVPGELPREGAAPIRDYFAHGVLPLTLTGVLAKSSNIGTVMAARKISGPRLQSYLTKFGLGRRTGIGVRGESAGKMPSSWLPMTKDTATFGQGYSATALQMLAGMNTIANAGTYVSPSLVRGSATTDGGEKVGTDQRVSRRVVSHDTAAKLTRMMEPVTGPDGVAPGAAVPEYRVAGKTGTAQRVDPKCGCYAKDQFTVSFAGFAPADKPEFTAYVMVQNPRNGGGGGSVAGPAFSKIMSFLLRRYQIPPTGSKPSKLPLTWTDR